MNTALAAACGLDRSAADRFFFSSRRRHTRSLCDWSSDVCLPIFNGGEPHGKEAEHQAAGQGEAQLGVYHGQTRADELVELGAAVLRGPADTFVVDNRPGGIAADQLGAPEELLEQAGVPPGAAEAQASQRQGKRP